LRLGKTKKAEFLFPGDTRIFHLTVPDRDSGCCPDPGIPGTSSEGASEAGEVLQGETGPSPPSAKEGGSRGPVMMGGVPPTNSRPDTAESDANIVRTVCI
jgi:hypothetical protein